MRALLILWVHVLVLVLISLHVVDLLGGLVAKLTRLVEGLLPHPDGLVLGSHVDGLLGRLEGRRRLQPLLESGTMTTRLPALSAVKDKALNGTATLFSPMPRKPPTPMTAVEMRPVLSKSTSLMSPIFSPAWFVTVSPTN